MAPQRALVVVHEPGQTAGRIGHRLGERGVELTETLVSPVRDDPSGSFAVESPDEFDLVVTMGSQWHLHEPGAIASWVFDELDFLRRADAGGVPVLGVCFGAQLLATALGGSSRSNGADQIGWCSPVEFTPVMAGPWFEWHSDGIVPPDDADVLARDSVGVQAFSLRSNLAVQFHPEVGSAQLASWFELGAADDLRRAGIDPDALIDETERRNDDALARCDGLVDWFLDEVVRA